MQVKRHWGNDLILQMSAKLQSASNGVAEKAIQEVDAHVRTMLMAVEKRMGFRLELDMAAIFSLIEYAAEVINRSTCRNMTARQLLNGKVGNLIRRLLQNLGRLSNVYPLDSQYSTIRRRAWRRLNPGSRKDCTLGWRETLVDTGLAAPWCCEKQLYQEGS